MMILIDSSIWIDFFNGNYSPQIALLRDILRVGMAMTADLIIAEVLQGFKSQADFQAAQKALLACEVKNICGEGSELAVRSAENFRFLRKKGVTVSKTIDCLIATFAIENKIPLLHKDKDFDHFEKFLGLKVLRRDTG